MSLCSNLDVMGSCGDCKYGILSMQLAKNTTILQLSKIGSNFLHKQEFNKSLTLPSTVKLVSVWCNREISFTTTKKYNDIDYTLAKTIYCHLIENWYIVNNITSTSITKNEVDKNLSIIRNADNIQIARIYSIKITKYLEKMTVCNGRCSTIIPHKEVSNCRFELGNIDTIVNFEALGLVDVFNSILRKMKDVTTINLYIDIDTSYVMCNGNVSSTLRSSKTSNKSGLDNVKGIYTRYLRAWCSKNVIKCSDTDKIRSFIERINNCNSIADMYTLNHKLLDILV